MKQLLVEADLDDVLSAEEQQAWLADPSGFASEPRLPLDPDQVQRMRYRPNFLRMTEDASFAQVIGLLKRYVEACIPVARRTELSFWSVSCLPATNRTHHPRWAAISIAEMEMFVLGWLPGGGGPWAFLNLSGSALEGGSVVERLERLGIEVDSERLYRAAGGDDVRLNTGADTFSAMADALRDPDVVRAARMLSLHVMRKRPNWYAKYHCFDLADRLL